MDGSFFLYKTLLPPLPGSIAQRVEPKWRPTCYSLIILILKLFFPWMFCLKLCECFLDELIMKNIIVYPLLTSVLLFFSIHTIKANSGDDLTDVLRKIETAVTNVSLDKFNVNQQFTFNATDPYQVILTQEETGQKGKTIQTLSEFNLSDIDINLINRVVSGKVMFVQVKTRNQQKLIKATENGVFQGYIHTLKVYVNDVDEARTIIDNLKLAVPKAAALLKNRLNVSGYEAMLSWLKSNIGNVAMAKGTLEQTFSSEETIVGKVKLQTVESAGNKSVNREYSFNLSDISPNLILFDVKGKDVLVKLTTVMNSDLIKVVENGKPGNYINTLSVYASGIDQARDLTTIFKLITEKAPEKVAAALPKLTQSVSGVMSENAALIGTIDGGNQQISQTLEGNCDVVFSRVTSTPKDSKEEKYYFSLRDLNPSTLEFRAKGNLIYIDLVTVSSQKLIKFEKNGQMNSYTDRCSLLANNPDDAREFVYRLKKAIRLCNDQFKSEVPSGTLADIVAWLAGKVTEVSLDNEVVSQVLTNPEGDDIRLEITTASAKSSSTGVYEFNMCDLDPNLVDFSVSGKNIFIRLVTKYRQKIIKTYKNGKAQPYENEVFIRANDVTSARNLLDGFRAAIGKCK